VEVGEIGRRGEIPEECCLGPFSVAITEYHKLGHLVKNEG
jgi:hypothetical protein